MKIVIIGHGWVGQANSLALTLMGYKVYFFDPQNPEYHYRRPYEKHYRKIRPLDHPLQFDSENTVYIVCVGDRTLPSGEQDIKNIKKALNSLSKAKGTVILRSTILPANLQDLNFHFYIPEFLHEVKAVEECVKPHFFAIGDRKIKPEPNFIKDWRKNAYKVFEGTPEEASLGTTMALPNSFTKEMRKAFQIFDRYLI